MSNEKQALRDKMLKVRNSLSKETRDAASETIQNNVIVLDEFRNANVVGAYHPVGSEVSTLEILSAVLKMGKHLALPRVEDGSMIVFVEVKDLEDLEVGKYNIMQPTRNCLNVSEMDLVLVPGIAWDKHGYRLGYGKGYYDRYLASIHTTTLGLAYDFQVLENIPHEKNDFRVNRIVTEEGVINCIKLC